MTSLISSKLCDDVCINYLCAVNFFDENETVKVYALGSGCIEDVLTNCGPGIGFPGVTGNIEFNYIYTSSCAKENGIKDCAFSLPDLASLKEHIFWQARFCGPTFAAVIFRVTFFWPGHLRLEFWGRVI
uniref:Uncharacterized protein n=1 Tax=Panagrolaimus davidi TaxID=227884 RepID=A0A914QNU6_9BILA